MTNSVSIIISFYNLEKYAKRMLDSLVAQTDHSFEVIVCNDGSTDNTLQLLVKYKLQFEKVGTKYIIIDKENGGLSSSINACLQKVTSSYFMSADGDDWYDNNLIKEVKSEIIKNDFPTIGFIGVKLWGEKSENVELLDRKTYNMSECNVDWVYRYLTGKNTICYGGIYYLNIKQFEKIYPNRTIYNSRHGQNWQILIPILNTATPVISHNTYYNVLIRNQSMSHSNSPIKIIEREDGYYDILMNIYKYVNSNNKAICQRIINSKSLIIMNLAFKYGDKKYFYKHFWRYSRHKNNIILNLKLLIKSILIIFKKS